MSSEITQIRNSTWISVWPRHDQRRYSLTDNIPVAVSVPPFNCVIDEKYDVDMEHKRCRCATQKAK
jgi:hypothetical protein